MEENFECEWEICNIEFIIKWYRIRKCTSWWWIRLFRNTNTPQGKGGVVGSTNSRSRNSWIFSPITYVSKQMYMLCLLWSCCLYKKICRFTSCCISKLGCIVFSMNPCKFSGLRLLVKPDNHSWALPESRKENEWIIFQLIRLTNIMIFLWWQLTEADLLSRWCAIRRPCSTEKHREAQSERYI